MCSHKSRDSVSSGLVTNCEVTGLLAPPSLIKLKIIISTIVHIIVTTSLGVRLFCNFFFNGGEFRNISHKQFKTKLSKKLTQAICGNETK